MPQKSHTLPLLLIAATSLHASATRIGFKDAEATARGNAFAATADTAAAVYYNPAGLTQIDGQDVSVGAYVIQVESNHNGALGRSKMKREAKVVPNFYYGWSPEDKPYALGIGLYAPFGLSTDWTGTTLATAATKSEQKTLSLALEGAWEIAPGLSIGAGPVFHKAETTLASTAFRFNGDGNEVGFNAGILWKPAPKHSFGVSYQHHYNMEQKGTMDITGTGTFNASTNFAFPEVIIAGYSYRPSPEWNFEFNLDWTNWERLNTLSLNPAIFGPLNNIALNWNSGFFYDFGVTRQLGDGWSISGGYTYAENSIPDSTYTPAIPDANRHLFAVGFGYKTGQCTLNFNYQLGYSSSRQVSGSPYGVLTDGSYKNRTHALSASLEYRF